jgi:hypothetical protein
LKLDSRIVLPTWRSDLVSIFCAHRPQLVTLTGNYNPPTNATNTTTGGLPTQIGGVSSNSTSNNSTCGAPPFSTINGFPAAACGSSFDQDLDNAIGYLDFDDADFTSSLGEFLPGLPSNDTNESDYETDDEQEYRRKRGLIERRWSLLGFVKKVAGVST